MATATLTATPPDPALFAEGARVVVAVNRGYRLCQDRPFACRYSCKCGACDGTTTLHEGTSRGVAYYADNSIEALIVLDDEELVTGAAVWPEAGRHIVRFRAPSGDACY
jgi:hypothetical protein